MKRKKINKINYINRSSVSDLYTLASKIGLENLIIIPLNEFNKKIENDYENVIINLGNSTHWVAVNTKKKLYFDSYSEAPPPPLKNYKVANKDVEIQSIKGYGDSMCGQLSTLWLYYIKNKSNKAFYDLFRDVYKT